MDIQSDLSVLFTKVMQEDHTDHLRPQTKDRDAAFPCLDHKQNGQESVDVIVGRAS